MRTTKTILGAGLLLLCGAAAAAAERPAKVEGEVVQVQQQVRTANEGELEALTVRTRQGEQLRLLLGRGGSEASGVRVGDRVRARLSAGGPTADGYRVRAMRLQRTGQTFRYRDAAGDLLQTRMRSRDRDGTGAGDRTRARSRIHEPGTGGCPRGGGGGRGGRR